MARSPKSYDPSEPRDPKKALPYTYPYSDNIVAGLKKRIRPPSKTKLTPLHLSQPPSTAPDTLAIVAAMFASLAVITRYPVYIYFGFLFSISAINTGKKLDKSRRATSVSGPSYALKVLRLSGLHLLTASLVLWFITGWSGLLFVLTAFLSVYYPLVSGVAVKAPYDFWSKPFPLGLGAGTIPAPRLAQVVEGI
ncbi:BZ3500_MvSof-1268-A1-R1_Chr9g10409 [Microbotryum saponariae]|uniref:BZ3500_MvSof-1268-A1-R1_Chr9g10409 protein n=1 Tax=Microbotryum saponariae TaxID=289078 RepID=A0A2X0MC94_9BASI|nr:BZ3501_MvSof-1269-A2-R1_Chr9g10159 [Microbotryum saponariae]SDA00045.1 BZ3500_MvSof-1268-A1-R1_Chr9g10409 [Microbotryum saponariae]